MPNRVANAGKDGSTFMRTGSAFGQIQSDEFVAEGAASRPSFQENGLRVLTPERWKSEPLRVTTVSLCSSPVAAIRPSETGSGWLRHRRPQRSAMAVVIGRM